MKIDFDCDRIIDLTNDRVKKPLDAYQEIMISQILTAAAEQFKGC